MPLRRGVSSPAANCPPALLTRMSTRSVALATASRNAPTWSGSRTSHGCAKHRSPSSSATAAIGSGWMSREGRLISHARIGIVRQLHHLASEIARLTKLQFHQLQASLPILLLWVAQTSSSNSGASRRELRASRMPGISQRRLRSSRPLRGVAGSRLLADLQQATSDGWGGHRAALDGVLGELAANAMPAPLMNRTASALIAGWRRRANFIVVTPCRGPNGRPISPADRLSDDEGSVNGIRARIRRRIHVRVRYHGLDVDPAAGRRPSWGQRAKPSPSGSITSSTRTS